MGTSSQEQLPLLTDYDPDSAYNSAYQTIYANIRFNWDTKRSKQYMIQLTSPASSHGQQVAALNVAVAAAQNGTPTILVDADLRMPGLQKRFGLGELEGLSDLLTEETVTQQKVSGYLAKVFIPDLYLLCAGRASLQIQESSRLFATKLPSILDNLRQFLVETESKENRPGLIIFQSPAVLSGIDAIQIGSKVDQTFLAIVAGHTTRTQALQAVEHLQRARVSVGGTILLEA